MAFILNIFRINILNSFYKSQTIKDDFDMIPTKQTKRWFEERNLRLVRQPNSIDVIWLADNHDNPLQVFREKSKDITLSFIMTLNNKKMFNLFDLESGYATNQVYYFHNHQDHRKNLLHKSTYVSCTDLVDIKEVNTYPEELGDDILAVIDIDLNQWAALDHKKYSILEHYQYQIHIQSRSTIWRYYFVDPQQKLNTMIKILDRNGTSHFKNVKIAKEDPITYTMESTKPMPFHDQYEYIFSLYQSDDSNMEAKKVLKTLPYPGSDDIKRDKNNKKYYSDIVIQI